MKGSLATDVVQVAGFVVDRQVIAIADSLTGIKENGIDGSFGLGLMDLSFNGKLLQHRFFFCIFLVFMSMSVRSLLFSV